MSISASSLLALVQVQGAPEAVKGLLDFVVFYDEQDISLDDLDVIVETLIGQEKPYTFPDADKEYSYYMDDVVFVAPHRARLHLSRELTA